MSGPIVRSGPTPQYSQNWENAFGQKKAKPAAKKSDGKPAKKRPAKKKK